MIVLLPYINLQCIKPFLDNKMSIFEEYGAFNILYNIDILTYYDYDYYYYHY